MIHHFGACGIGLLALCVSGCGQATVVSQWAATPLAIDGDGAEWPISYTTYVEDTRGVIGVANDDSMVYLLFRFRDEKTARKAMVGGVTAWWSPSGTKDREVGLRFQPVISLRDVMHGQPGAPSNGDESRPLDREPDRQTAAGAPGGQPPDSGEDTSWMPPGRGFGRIRMPTPEEGVLHRDIRLLTDKDPVGTSEWSDARLRVQTGYKKGTYTYELALPLGAGDYAIGIAPDHDSKVYVSVTLGGVPEEDRDLVAQGARRPPSRPDDGEVPADGSGEEPPDGGPGGMGGGGGRGHGGPGSGVMRNPLAELTETIDVSFAITLATSAQ